MKRYPPPSPALPLPDLAVSRRLSDGDSCCQKTLIRRPCWRKHKKPISWSSRSVAFASAIACAAALLFGCTLPLVQGSGTKGSEGTGGRTTSHLRRHARRQRQVKSIGTKDQRSTQQQEKIVPYEYLDSEAIKERLSQLSSLYPDLANLTTSQELYDLPAAGSNATDCAFDHDENFVLGCKNYILTIEDKVAHPIGSDSWKTLPEVFLSGSLHGNERVGPTVVVETASLLLEAANCEALPRTLAQVKTSNECRSDLEARGVTRRVRRWLARLVSTRRIIVVPTANALGYFRNERGEDSIDPNRDFPFDLTDFKLCMQTIAGRTVNEIFRDHLIQLSFTFHAGMQAIGYEWGAPSYYNDSTSPDDVAQHELALGYSWYGGPINDDVENSTNYPAGTMNSLVYPVRGGMEDWSYAASWDTNLVRPCSPDTYGGYPKEKTTYDGGTLRMFNMLVETSDDKEPTNLGSDEDLFGPNGGGNGHVSRNVRLSLMLVDVVEPYGIISGVDNTSLRDDVVPGMGRNESSCRQTRAMSVPADLQHVDVEWTVGGGFTVDETFLIYGKWDDLDGEGMPLGCTSQPTQAQLDAFYNSTTGASALSFTAVQRGGRTRWHRDGAHPLPDGGEDSSVPYAGVDFPPDPIFTSEVDLSNFQEGDVLGIYASFKFDNSWLETERTEGEEAPLRPPPQSHMANVRTNTTWRFESSDGRRVLQGRREWFSTPLTIVVGAPGTDIRDVSVRIPSWVSDF